MNAELCKLLMDRRWYVMQAAREQGAGWEEIGATPGMRRQSRLGVVQAQDQTRGCQVLV